MSVLLSWEDYINSNIANYRMMYARLNEEQKEIVESNEEIFAATLNNPCQVFVIDFVPWVCYIILHKQRSKDQLTIATDRIGLRNEDFEKVRGDKRFIEVMGKDDINTLVCEIEQKSYRPFMVDQDWVEYHDFIPSIGVALFFDKVGKVHDNQRLAKESFSHTLNLIERKENSRRIEKIQDAVAKIEKSAEAIPIRLELRNKIIESTQLLKEEIRPLSEKQKEMQEDLIGLKKLVGTKSFGEWKSLISEIDKLSTRIDAFTEIKNSYDRVLEQQTKVIEQQSSFVTWIKYAAILVPIAVILVPVVETILRFFLGT